MTDLTNEELNEAVALALGRGRKNRNKGHWYPADRPWATDAQACLDDLLPVVRAKYPSAEWQFRELRHIDRPPRWRAYCTNPPLHRESVDVVADTLARAICLVFLDVMKP